MSVGIGWYLCKEVALPSSLIVTDKFKYFGMRVKIKITFMKKVRGD
jgi:hypothetical protein